MARGFLDKLAFEVEPTKKTAIVLTARLRYVDERGRLFTVPKGFTCDLASVPKIFRSISTPWNQSARAGVLHDCGYRWYEIWKLPRYTMDHIYKGALRADGVSRFRAWVQKTAVRMGAGGAWDRWRKTPKSKKGIAPKIYTL